MRTTDSVPENRRDLLERYADELARMNRGVNLVARASASRIMEDHIEHCLALAMRRFPVGSRVIDWGSGGGLPAIPLAICFPAVEFVAVDSVAKKTDAVRIMARRLGLDNVIAWNGRAENWHEPMFCAVSRATATINSLWSWTHRWMAGSPNPEPDVQGEGGEWPSGLVCLKGGDLADEKAALLRSYPDTQIDEFALETWFERPEWRSKYILMVTRRDSKRAKGLVLPSPGPQRDPSAIEIHP